MWSRGVVIGVMTSIEISAAGSPGVGATPEVDLSSIQSHTPSRSHDARGTQVAVHPWSQRL